MNFLSSIELESGLDLIEASPADMGRLELIVRRPQSNLREELASGELDPSHGLVGDRWNLCQPTKPSDFDTQLTLMNSRTIDLIAVSRDRWSLAGDQLYVDLDLSVENLPAGTRLAIGEAIVVVTPEPHTGCRKFIDRFGRDAHVFVNSATGRRLNLRGIYVRVERRGAVRVGESIRKLVGSSNPEFAT